MRRVNKVVNLSKIKVFVEIRPEGLNQKAEKIKTGRPIILNHKAEMYVCIDRVPYFHQ